MMIISNEKFKNCLSLLHTIYAYETRGLDGGVQISINQDAIYHWIKSDQDEVEKLVQLECLWLERKQNGVQTFYGFFHVKECEFVIVCHVDEVLKHFDLFIENVRFGGGEFDNDEFKIKHPESFEELKKVGKKLESVVPQLHNFRLVGLFHPYESKLFI